MTALCDWLRLGAVKEKEGIRMASIHFSLSNWVKPVLFIDPQKRKISLLHS